MGDGCAGDVFKAAAGAIMPIERMGDHVDLSVAHGPLQGDTVLPHDCVFHQHDDVLHLGGQNSACVVLFATVKLCSALKRPRHTTADHALEC